MNGKNERSRTVVRTAESAAKLHSAMTTSAVSGQKEPGTAVDNNKLCVYMQTTTTTTTTTSPFYCHFSQNLNELH